MKKIKNIFNSVLLTVALGCGTMLSSCTDFLTIYPTNSTIHENYWQTADDVNGMVATSYLQLLSENAVSRMIVWGELRGDNMNVRSNADNKYKYIVEANIKENNEFCNWAIFYRAINFANMVIEFAPEVTERDPDFTEGDLNTVLGEMYALRALSHFYLVRTFRDIPLANKASLNDADLIDYPQVHPVVALDSIMKDLDKASGLVMRSGGFPNLNAQYNYGRITLNAVNALKADVNLWRAAFAKYHEADDSLKQATGLQTPDYYYQEAVNNCDDVINAMNASMAEWYEEYGTPTDRNNVGPGTKNPYYLAYETTSGSTSTSTSSIYTYLFGSMKDYISKMSLEQRGEVIFELIFDKSINRNKAVSTLYGHSQENSGALCVTRSYASENSKYGENDRRFYYTTDARDLSGVSDGNSSSSAAASEVGIAKYACERAPGYNRSATSYRVANDAGIDANWIVYRKTDVMLMKAEALVNLQNPEPGQLTAAFELVKAVNDRSISVTADSLVYSDYPGKEDLMELVLDERVRELAFEGKRWYDLVRVALRDKTTQNILFVANKIEGGGASAVQKKMQTINSLFFPIAESELNVNPLLVQNPAYETSSSVEQH